MWLTCRSCPFCVMALMIIVLCGSAEGRLQGHASSGRNKTAPAQRWRFPLHQVAGTQHVDVYVGQPAVRQTWIVDTGSRFTATVCGGPYCTDCGSRNRNEDYLLSRSFTHRLIPCGNCEMTQECQPFISKDQIKQYGVNTGASCKVRQHYTEGSSWTAWEVNDIVAIAGAERVDGPEVSISRKTSDKQAKDDSDESKSLVWDWAVPMSFGCQTEMRGLFRKQYANGILGLESSEYSWISMLHKQKLIAERSFGLCLHPKGGWLTLGSFEDKLSYTQSPIQDLLSYSAKKWFNVDVQSVWLGEELLAGPHHNAHVISAFHHGKATILDSGTTDTFLPATLAPIFAESWESQTGLSFREKRKHSYTFSEFQRLPELHLLLAQNVTWTLFPKYYMDTLPLDEEGIIKPWSGYLRLTNRIYVDEPAGAVLGLNSMMGYHVEFHKDRIGIAVANCYV